MKKVFEMPMILLESMQAEDAVMTEEVNPWDTNIMSVTFDWS